MLFSGFFFFHFSDLSCYQIVLKKRRLKCANLCKIFGSGKFYFKGEGNVPCNVVPNNVLNRNDTSNKISFYWISTFERRLRTYAERMRWRWLKFWIARGMERDYGNVILFIAAVNAKTLQRISIRSDLHRPIKKQRPRSVTTAFYYSVFATVIFATVFSESC